VTTPRARADGIPVMGARGPKIVTLALTAGVVALALYPTLDRLSTMHATRHRLAEVDVARAALILDPVLGARYQHLGGLLASWETIGGCGAGASTGTGAGVKWIGRNVTGGLFHVELQGNYVHTSYGYNYIATALVSRDLSQKWNLGVSVPYLYKFMRDPAGIGVDVANKGPGDVNLLVTRRLGPINDWSTTLSLGVPTGTHDVIYGVDPLPQDRQLGLGRPTASLIVDHTIDNQWGPAVVGATANWRGGENELKNYRAPSASAYGYAGYLLGPLVPALGLSVSGVAGHDRNLTVEQATPLVGVNASASLEWSTDKVAILVGGLWGVGYTNSVGGAPPGWSQVPWVVALGVAFAPF
jgi:hypothetical protein